MPIKFQPLTIWPWNDPDCDMTAKPIVPTMVHKWHYYLTKLSVNIWHCNLKIALIMFEHLAAAVSFQFIWIFNWLVFESFYLLFWSTHIRPDRWTCMCGRQSLWSGGRHAWRLKSTIVCVNVQSGFLKMKFPCPIYLFCLICLYFLPNFPNKPNLPNLLNL